MQVAELRNYLQGDTHRSRTQQCGHCALSMMTNLLKRSLKA